MMWHTHICTRTHLCCYMEVIMHANGEVPSKKPPQAIHNTAEPETTNTISAKDSNGALIWFACCDAWANTGHFIRNSQWNPVRELGYKKKTMIMCCVCFCKQPSKISQRRFLWIWDVARKASQFPIAHLSASNWGSREWIVGILNFGNCSNGCLKPK